MIPFFVTITIGVMILVGSFMCVLHVNASNSIECPISISTIGFIAKVPLSNAPCANYIIEEKHCSWRLGLGSCGRVAESLHLKYEGDMLIIIQTCANGDYKEFHYKIEDIVGRITISYKS